MHRFIPALPVFLLLAVALLPGRLVAAPAPAPVAVETFLANHCFECHDDETTKGDLDLFSVPFDPANPRHFLTWEHVFHQVEQGEMPPKDKKQPTKAEQEQFLHALEKPLLDVVRAQVRATGRVHGRRLTRVEYEHSLHDLLGIDIPLVDRLPADETGDEFETIAEVQQISHFHLDKYLKAADAALHEALGRAIDGDVEYKEVYTAKQLASRASDGNYRGPENRNGEVRAWRILTQFSGRMPKTRVPESGWYRITIKDLRALNPGPDGVVWGTLRSGGGYSSEPVLYYVASVEATKEPSDHVYEAWIREGHLLEFKPGEGTEKPAPSGARGGQISYAGRNLEKQGFAGLAYKAIAIERIYPNASAAEVREKLLPGAPVKDGRPKVTASRDELARLIRTFAAQAFRRPVTAEQALPYVQLAAAELKESGRMRDAVHAGYRAILCSPRFLTFVERPGKLDDHSIATRLSYLFWNSVPDSELRGLADRGELTDPAVLAKQVNRMLADPKAERFIASFTDQWLNLKEIGFTSPDRRKFSDFDPIVQDSMVQETRAFLQELIRGDLSVRNFIAADFAMINTRLANHYSLPNTKLKPGAGLQRVSLPQKSSARGGLVTHGSILKVTADGAVTSPILRGVWLNERILGLPVPPPPPNVPAVEPDIRGATSIRDQLAKHSSQTSCAACHAKIDPAGFALESFDPVGKWRTKYGTAKNSAVVDPSGVTPDGIEFAGIGQWKGIYHDRPALLARTFCEHFLAYATGAPIGFADRAAVAKAVNQSKSSGYGLKSIIQSAIASEVFLNK